MGTEPNSQLSGFQLSKSTPSFMKHKKIAYYKEHLKEKKRISKDESEAK